MSAGRIVKTILIVFIAALLIGALKGADIYKKAFSANVFIDSDEEVFLYVHSGDTYDEVVAEISKLGVLKNEKSFNWTVKRKNYANHVKPGRYLLKNRMSNNDLVNKLRSGNQEPLQLTFNNMNRLSDFAARIGEQLEFSGDTLLSLLNDTAIQHKYGFDNYTIPAMFIPNTYEFYWNTSPQGFLERMAKEYDDFWTRGRKAKADKNGMTQTEVITLASIVNKEVRFDDEKETVAGLYINRINKGIRLQADPTLIFAMNDYSIRRVLNKHKKFKSPYNTYLNDGLPPGPICIPDIASIDAVLNYEKHNYIYMCAKEDFSGYHNFAKTLRAHNNNAAKYRRELNKRKIYK